MTSTFAIYNERFANDKVSNMLHSCLYFIFLTLKWKKILSNSSFFCKMAELYQQRVKISCFSIKRRFSFLHMSRKHLKIKLFSTHYKSKRLHVVFNHNRFKKYQHSDESASLMFCGGLTTIMSKILSRNRFSDCFSFIFKAWIIRFISKYLNKHKKTSSALHNLKITQTGSKTRFFRLATSNQSSSHSFIYGSWFIKL